MKFVFQLYLGSQDRMGRKERRKVFQLNSLQASRPKSLMKLPGEEGWADTRGYLASQSLEDKAGRDKITGCFGIFSDDDLSGMLIEIEFLSVSIFIPR